MSKPKRKKKDDGLQTFKVRCAIEYAHYLLVRCEPGEDPEELARKHCSGSGEYPIGDGDYDWVGEASHCHTTFEVEEAE